MIGPSALFIYSLWLCIVSGCIGCLMGMLVITWRSRMLKQQAKAVSSLQPDEHESLSDLPSREEIKSLLMSIGKINSQVDACVGLHCDRIEQITENLGSANSDSRDSLVLATKLLVTANQQLRNDLEAARIELKNQRELVDSFRQESRTDALTQLMNRRAFDGELNDQIRKLDRDNVSFSLLFIDIDHFKQVNDVHGHLNGDQILSSVAHCLKENLDVPASVARYGGEEFAVVIPGVCGTRAFQIAETLRQATESYPHCVEGQSLNVTVSIGVSEAIPGDTRVTVVERADQALFAAKNSGRNRCCHNLRKGGSSKPYFEISEWEGHPLPYDLLNLTESIRDCVKA